MKNLKSLSLIMLSVLAFSSLHAQKKTDKAKIIEYQLEYEFTGEVSSNLDSTFLIYCVFDTKDFKEIKNIIINTGEEHSKLKEVLIETHDSKRVKEKDKKIYVTIGTSDEYKNHIEVYTEDNAGHRTKAKHKNQI